MITHRLAATVTIALALCAAMTGCSDRVTFPLAAIPAPAAAGDVHRAYDLSGNGQADVLFYADNTGRVTRIVHGTDDVTLNALPPAQRPHLAIILDGFAYDLVRDLYAEGALRIFYPPSRVVATYPSMSDPAIADLTGLGPVPGIEAEYYDRDKNEYSGGEKAYLSGANQPYNALMDYRANLLVDAIGYSAPWTSYGHEVAGVKKAFDRNQGQNRRQTLAYLVSSAGVSTAMGADGQRRALQRIEQLANQVMLETKGQVTITLMSDHGHSFTPPTRITLEDHLKARGWRLRNTLENDTDVVAIRFGVVTYAALYAKDPARLAQDSVTAQGVDLASYRDGEQVIVLGPDGSRAVIRHRDGRYRYEPTTGDPLQLLKFDPFVKLSRDADGFCDADALLTATATHVYPAPLQRLWRAHHGLVQNTPDVLLSLKDDAWFGSTGFAAFAKVVSTHGSLNYRNSTAFIMSTAGPFPKALRSRDVPLQIPKLTGHAWPADTPAPKGAATQPAGD